MCRRYRRYMKNNIALCTLVPGERAVITGIISGADERRRMRELGMTDGQTVECVLRRGGISAYLIKGTLIALRRQDAAQILAEAQVKESVGDKGGCAVWL